MDIEKLTKMQIVLLTLLVSFVTSIATGIVTVTLMDQAPPAITQTLNRVVERTVERVVQDESKQGASVITKETTVVVKEEDLITDSINRNSKNIVRIKEVLKDGIEGPLLGLGIIVSKDGIIITDSSVIENSSVYLIETSKGEIFNANVVKTDGLKRPIFLLINAPEGEKITFPSATFSKSDSFKLGQTVLSLTGEKRTDVAIGIISGLVEDDVAVDLSAQEENKGVDINLAKKELEPKTIKALSIIKTSIDGKEVIAGSPLIDIFGEVIGISIKSSLVGKTALFTPINDVKSIVSEIIKNKNSTTQKKEE